jgi:replicative DNA helicase
MDLERLPRHDVDAEESEIWSLLIEGEAIHRIEDHRRPEDFFRESLRWCYEACLALTDRRDAINTVTVAHELERIGRLQELGGSGELHRLIAQVPTSLHIGYYAGIVARTALMRRLISASGQMAAIGYRDPPDADEALDEAEELLFGLRQERASHDFVHIRDVLSEILEAQTQVRTEALPRVSTGFADLDRLLGGLQRSDLIILAARTGLGKSSLALNIARNAALPPLNSNRPGAHVAIFSLEMSREELGQRLLSSEAGVDSQRLRLALVNDQEEHLIQEAMGKLAEGMIFIDDSAILRSAALRSKARRLHARYGLDLIIVDYLQLVQSSSSYNNRALEVGDISRSLKILARDLDVPVVACSQLSRATEMRSPPIPHLADLRESGSIEQDADVVLFIYRDDAYFTREEWERRNPAHPYPKGIAQVIVAKHRNGPTGQVSLYFFDKTAKFGDLTGMSG